MDRKLFLKSLVFVAALVVATIVWAKAAAAGQPEYPKDCLIIQAEKPAR
jgi:hypothetical protein